MSPIVKRVILLGVVALAGLAVVASTGGLFSRGLPAANSAAVATTTPASDQAGASATPGASEAPAMPARLQELQQKLAANPKDSGALAELADYFFRARRYAQAADLLYQATELEPKSALFHTRLGVALFYQGIPSMAQRELRQAIDLDPTNAEAHFNFALSMSHGPQADMNTARASWQTVVRLDGDGELGRRAREFLDQTAQAKDVPAQVGQAQDTPTKQ